MQAEMRHRMDDLYELVVHRSSEHLDAQHVFALFRDLEAYETRDLFSPHPDLPDLWMHRDGRDDLVTSSSCLMARRLILFPSRLRSLHHPDVRGPW